MARTKVSRVLPPSPAAFVRVLREWEVPLTEEVGSMRRTKSRMSVQQQPSSTPRNLKSSLPAAKRQKRDLFPPCDGVTLKLAVPATVDPSLENGEKGDVDPATRDMELEDQEEVLQTLLGGRRRDFVLEPEEVILLMEEDDVVSTVVEAETPTTQAISPASDDSVSHVPWPSPSLSPAPFIVTRSASDPSLLLKLPTTMPAPTSSDSLLTSIKSPFSPPLAPLTDENLSKLTAVPPLPPGADLKRPLPPRSLSPCSSLTSLPSSFALSSPPRIRPKKKVRMSFEVVVPPLSSELLKSLRRVAIMESQTTTRAVIPELGEW